MFQTVTSQRCSTRPRFTLMRHAVTRPLKGAGAGAGRPGACGRPPPRTARARVSLDALRRPAAAARAVTGRQRRGGRGVGCHARGKEAWGVTLGGCEMSTSSRETPGRRCRSSHLRGLPSDADAAEAAPQDHRIKRKVRSKGRGLGASRPSVKAKRSRRREEGGPRRSGWGRTRGGRAAHGRGPTHKVPGE